MRVVIIVQNNAGITDSEYDNYASAIEFLQDKLDKQEKRRSRNEVRRSLRGRKHTLGRPKVSGATLDQAHRMNRQFDAQRNGLSQVGQGPFEDCAVGTCNSPSCLTCSPEPMPRIGGTR